MACRSDKVSSFTRETRRETVAMVGVQALLCAVAALLSVVLSLGNQERAWYLLGTGESELSLSVWDGILQFFTFMILFTNFVPISLLVTLGAIPSPAALARACPASPWQAQLTARFACPRRCAVLSQTWSSSRSRG